MANRRALRRRVPPVQVDLEACPVEAENDGLGRLSTVNLRRLRAQ
jgi:hypothetical protein